MKKETDEIVDPTASTHTPWTKHTTCNPQTRVVAQISQQVSRIARDHLPKDSPGGDLRTPCQIVGCLPILRTSEQHLVNRS